MLLGVALIVLPFSDGCAAFGDGEPKSGIVVGALMFVFRFMFKAFPLISNFFESWTSVSEILCGLTLSTL